jgi:hypothetical protein
MPYLDSYKKDLYRLRFSPMTKPACEVANLTKLESHTTRARMMMLWRITENIINWGPREVEILYESTLDSISEAFDVYKNPISPIMLAARADVWTSGIAPKSVQEAIRASETNIAVNCPKGKAILLASEIAQIGNDRFLEPMLKAIANIQVQANPWVVQSGALAYALGAQEIAQKQAKAVVDGIRQSGASIIIADGPETIWAINKIYPKFGVKLPEIAKVKSLTTLLNENLKPHYMIDENVFIHDSRPSCLLADAMASGLAVLPSLPPDDTILGKGEIYESIRELLRKFGAKLVRGYWMRSLAKSCGADDGLWLTYPNLAYGLAEQRLKYALSLGSTKLVTDSPLAVNILTKCNLASKIEVKLLSELVINS